MDQDAVLGVVVKDGVKGGKQACKHMVQGVGAVWAKRRVVPSEPSRRGGSRIQERFTRHSRARLLGDERSACDRSKLFEGRNRRF